MLVSNHSYGLRQRDLSGNPLLPNYYFGVYITESRTWDEIMFNAPYYLMIVAAGNSGNDDTVNGDPLSGFSAFDKLTGHSTSKNNLVVANSQDANISSGGDLISAVINSSSSEGPTDDLRIKPDLTGNGTTVYSTFEWSDSAYNTISGTSMASPNIAGSLLLLQEHYYNLNTNYLRSATLKGLALHTSDDLGTVGPDAVYGWGLLNAKKAAKTITTNGNESLIEELVLNSGSTYTFTVDSDGVNPLMASISWTDRPGTASTTLNSSTPVLVNDLDIRISKSGTTFNPFRLQSVTPTSTGDNIVDSFERIDVNNASGTYTITISHKGTLVGSSQNYSLIVTGLSNIEISGSSIICNSTNETFTLTNSTPPVSWQVSSKLQIVSSSNTQVTVKAINSSASGSGYVKAITANTTIQKDVWVGKPKLTSASISGSTNVNCNGIQIYKYNCGISGAESTRWEVSLQFDDVSSVNNKTLFADPTNKGSGYVTFVASNACGEAIFCKPVNVNGFSCGADNINFPNAYSCGGSGPGPFSFRVSPNPSNSVIDITLKNADDKASKQINDITELRLYDFTGNILIQKKDRNLKSIDVSMMKEGMYYLEIISSDAKEIHRIIVDK